MSATLPPVSPAPERRDSPSVPPVPPASPPPSAGSARADAVGGVRRRPSPFIVAVAFTVSLLGLLPLGYVIVTGILTGWTELSALVFRPRVGELLANTVGLVVVTVPLCAAIGVGAAWLVGRTRLPGAPVFAVLQAVLNTGAMWLTVVAVMFSLIGAFYYLRVVKVMWFDEPADTAPLAVPFDMRATLSANGIAIVVLGIYAGPLLAACSNAMLKTLAS